MPAATSLPFGLRCGDPLLKKSSPCCGIVETQQAEMAAETTGGIQKRPSVKGLANNRHRETLLRLQTVCRSAWGANIHPRRDLHNTWFVYIFQLNRLRCRSQSILWPATFVDRPFGSKRGESSQDYRCSDDIHLKLHYLFCDSTGGAKRDKTPQGGSPLGLTKIFYIFLFFYKGSYG